MSAKEKATSGVCTTQAAIESQQHESTANSKLIATLRAKFALAGFSVHDLADGGFVVCRWNLSRPCVDLAELVAFARQTGVQP